MAVLGLLALACFLAALRLRQQASSCLDSPRTWRGCTRARAVADLAARATLTPVDIVLARVNPGAAGESAQLGQALEANEQSLKRSAKYDDTYPLRKSLIKGQFVIAAISDMDKASAVPDRPNMWRSFLKEAVLRRNSDGTFNVEWTNTYTIHSALSVGGRGMELSALVVFNGMLYTCDDRTGVVYSLHNDGHVAGEMTAIPRYILQEADGETAKNLKCEWMAVKDGHLFVGGFGKEFVNDKDGTISSEGPMWTKVIDVEGRVQHVDWRENFRVLRRATGTEHPAYLLHEAIAWHDPERRWYFLPRRVSHEPYDEAKDEVRGSNMLLSIPPSFDAAQLVKKTIGEIIPTRGFSCFKFLPDSSEEIVALKSVEHQGVTETYIMVFNAHTGRVLMPETRFADVKFEGIEFLEG